MSVLKLILMTCHLNLVFPRDLSTKHFPAGQRLLWAVGMMEKSSGGGQVRVRIKSWYLLSNCPFLFVMCVFFLSFCEPGANNKLLLCAISEP